MTSKTQARVAGALYLGTIIAGVYAQVFTRVKLAVPDDPQATATNILASETVYRSGLFADIVMLFCYIAVTVLFLGMFARTDRLLSQTAAAFSMTGIAVLAVTGIFHAAPMLMLREAPYLAALGPDAAQHLTRLSLDLHSEGYIISLLFFGMYCLLLGVLIWRSGLLPKTVAVLMMAGGIAHLFNNFAYILDPRFARDLPSLLRYPPLIGELALAFWLMLFGIKAHRA